MRKCMKFKSFILTGIFVLLCVYTNAQVTINRDNPNNPVLKIQPLKPEIETFDPFVWNSEIPDDCPFKRSKNFSQIEFLGIKSGFRFGDTFYPTWAEDDLMYSPYTDGGCCRLDGKWDYSNSGYSGTDMTTTGQAVMEGKDPTSLIVYSLGTESASPLPYKGRYPCGSLFHNGIWYYGTYCLSPDAFAEYGNMTINWPWLGPFVGFRISKDRGITWKDCPHTPEKSIFGESGINGYPVKIGSPHFVDFGKNMEHSTDGKVYMVAHGADINDEKPRFWNSSWINGDQIYLLRVTPSEENMNDLSQWEFYGGKDKAGKPIWTHDFSQIKPLLEWNNNMGCVTVTYNPVLKKYLMCITDGGNTASKMHTYILESDSITGEWHIISYMKNFGEQAYFVNIPSRFIEKEGDTMWLMYSGNFATNWNGETIQYNPPGSHYGLVMQKIKIKK